MWYEKWRRKVTTTYHLFTPYICQRFRFLRNKFLAFDVKAFVTAFPGCSALSLMKDNSPALGLI